MNYLRQINGFWEKFDELPDGKPQHIVLYFALLDINNSCGWKDVFSVSFGSITNKTRLDKDTYYSSCEFLHKHGFLKTWKKGRNKFSQAQFSISLLCGISESAPNASRIYTETEPNVNRSSTESEPNILKQINNKTVKQESCKQPELKEIIDFFVLKKLDENEALRFFNYNQSKNWKNVSEWKPLAENWILKINNINSNNHDNRRYNKQDKERYFVGKQDYSSKF